MRMNRFSRVAALGAVIVTGVAIAPTAALAASTGKAYVAEFGVYFNAAKGAVNDVKVSGNGKTITIDDRVTITPGAGCTRVGKDRTKVKCTTNAAFFYLTLGDKNDKATVTSSWRNTTDGGAGKDVLSDGPGPGLLMGGAGNDKISGNKGQDSLEGGAGADTLDGAAGDDGLFGGPGNDALQGGAGSDYLDGDKGSDSIHGGPGVDVVGYSNRSNPVTVDLTGSKRNDGEAGEKDTVGIDIESIVGGRGNDRLAGNGAANNIYGGPGHDSIRGAAGNDMLIGAGGDDQLDGNSGDDHLYAGFEPGGPRDSAEQDDPAAKDVLNGGSETRFWGDTCVGSAVTVMTDCEHRSS
jgi:Ca2+-binding RTX toxin-like protein